LRVTDAKTVEIVEMVLAASINKQIVGYITAGGKAIGLCGDGNMGGAQGQPHGCRSGFQHRKVVDLGFVGEPESRSEHANQVIGREMIPVLAPVATRPMAARSTSMPTLCRAIAGALKAKRLLLLTDVPGVLDKSKNLIAELSMRDARKLIADGTISGMIPKVETCIYALTRRRRRRHGRQGAARRPARAADRSRGHADASLTSPCTHGRNRSDARSVTRRCD
jgi:acetylglutamate kinase